MRNGERWGERERERENEGKSRRGFNVSERALLPTFAHWSSQKRGHIISNSSTSSKHH